MATKVKSSPIQSRNLKVALITGVAGLIGEELAHTYLSAGFKVIGIDKQKPKFENMNFEYKKCDLSDPTKVRTVFKTFKRVDVYIHNAAATDLTFVPFHKMTLAQWQRGLSTNVTSFFVSMQSLEKGLRKSKGSAVVINSTRHLMSEKDTPVYSASKGALASLTHSLAVTLGPDVRVNSVSPGWIAHADENLSPKDHSQHPVGRVGEPRDIAQMCLYLTSEHAGFITGQDFVVDGGMTKKMIYADE